MTNIEVICIDDGSTDQSGKIADEYGSDLFPIFRVIHTENQGLSAARNRGIDEAKADWIMFVDSDDWVEPEFCIIPYMVAFRNNADMVIFGAQNVKHGRVKKPRKSEAPVGLMDELSAHCYGRVVVWNKLYRASLFKEILYPNGYVHEDQAITHLLVHKSQKVIRIQNNLYYHVIRKGSISHTHSVKNKRDAWIATEERNKWLLRYSDLGDNENLLCSCAISYLTRHVPGTDYMYKRAIEILDRVDSIPKEISWKQKIALIAWRNNKKVFYLLCKLTGRMQKLYE